MPTKREVLYLTGGIVLGVYVPKKAPKLALVQVYKYAYEVMRAYFRLRKILMEEYYRIEEAIKTEEVFLQMVNPMNKFTKDMSVSFEVVDNGHDRSLTLHANNPKPKE